MGQSQKLLTWVGASNFLQLSIGLENFPQKRKIFNFLSCWVKKNICYSQIKYTRVKARSAPFLLQVKSDQVSFFKHYTQNFNLFPTSQGLYSTFASLAHKGMYLDPSKILPSSVILSSFLHKLS